MVSGGNFINMEEFNRRWVLEGYRITGSAFSLIKVCGVNVMGLTELLYRVGLKIYNSKRLQSKKSGESPEILI